MEKRKFLIPVALALSALTSNVSASAITSSDSAIRTTGTSTTDPEPTAVKQPSVNELFDFVLKASEGAGDVFAGHRSHRSHSSHRSHYSSR